MDELDHGDGPDAERRVVARTVRDVSEALEHLRCNVALSKLMAGLPHVRSREGVDVFVRLLAPLAPYLAEELWRRLGRPFSVHTQPWPEADEAGPADPRITLVVQVDGTVRARLELARGAGEAEAVATALEEEAVASALAGAAPSRVVFVPDRVLNVVT